MAKLGIGHCPVCKLDINTVGHGKTPRHGHIKGWDGKWLPPCPGSGKPAIWFIPLKRNSKKGNDMSVPVLTPFVVVGLKLDSRCVLLPAKSGKPVLGMDRGYGFEIPDGCENLLTEESWKFLAQN